MNIIDTRKYFDYELAYKMYKKCIKLLNKGGIDELDEYFEETGERTNGYTAYYGADYNTTIYITNTNFGNDKENETWLEKCNGLEVTGEVDIYSYGGGDDTLFINDISYIEERINNLLDYARENEYTLDDIYKEYDSLNSVIKSIKDDYLNIIFKDIKEDEK